MASGMSKAADFILGAISIIIGLVLLPIVAGFVASSKADTNVSSIAGLSNLLDLVAYGFCFGLVGAGVALIWVGYKK